MGFFTQFLAGSVSAGALTYIFHSTIISKTTQLSLELSELSARLNSLTAAPTYTVPYEGIPTRIPLKEAIKSRVSKLKGGDLEFKKADLDYLIL